MPAFVAPARTGATRLTLAIFIVMMVSFSVVVPVGAAAASTDRIAGQSRYTTAVAISQAAWNKYNTDVVYLVRSDVPVDGLVAGTLRGGPILLADKNGLPAVTYAEISRLGNPRIVLIGGSDVISDSVGKKAARSHTFRRWSGRNRILTSIAISRNAWPGGSDTVYIADSWGGDNMGSPDAVIGGTLTGGPILYVDRRFGPTAAVVDEIARLGAANIVQLGSHDFHMHTTKTLGGRNRFATSVSVANEEFPHPTRVYLANSHVFVDATTAGTLTDGPILLSPTASLPPVICEYLSDTNPVDVIAIGGPSAISHDTLSMAKECAANVHPATDGDVSAGPESSTEDSDAAIIESSAEGTPSDDATGSSQPTPSPFAALNVFALPHPDDEWQIWSQFEASSDDYNVFYLATHGEATGYCEAKFSKACSDRRIHAWLGFLADMGLEVPTNRSALTQVTVPTNGARLQKDENGTVRTVAPVLEVYAGANFAVVVTNLGDQDLTTHEATWAIRSIINNRAALGMPADIPLGDLVSAYYNPSDTRCYVYPHLDHRALHNVVGGQDFGFHNRIQTVCGPTSLVRHVSKEATSRAWNATNGAFAQHYGWLGRYQLSEDQSRLFMRTQSFAIQ